MLFLGSRSKPGAGFTLVELLVVMGIIAILLVATIPAMKSLSTSNGRKVTASLLLGEIEQARALAIKDRRPSYVAFAAQPTDASSSISDTTILDRYFYHSAAIYEEDPSDNTKKIQVTPWKVFPTGVSLRTEISFSGSKGAWTSSDFAFTPSGTGASENFPYIKFDESGALAAPSPSASGPILLRFFEGFVSGTYEKPTSKANKDETISIARTTGRATYVP